MIEVLETGSRDKVMVYVPVQETAIIRRLFNLKREAAQYYGRQGQLEAYHWLLSPVTVAKLRLESLCA